MTTPFAVIDAFTDQAFRGNPAAVCLMSEEKSDEWLLNVAREMNLSETAFVWPSHEDMKLRWFTPTIEVDLCGHATLAAAHALWTVFDSKNPKFSFHTRSGILTAIRNDNLIVLDFPSVKPTWTEPNVELANALGVQPLRCAKNIMDAMILVKTEAEVLACQPDFRKLAKQPYRGVILTSISDVGKPYNYVSRFFAPASGVDEDPVTGSAHCCLSPFWSDIFGKPDLIGYQASARGGIVRTHQKGDRVELSGSAVTISRGEILV
jgi:PhzF family phenazine biosynthesis protein